jgi:hypothetical protein
MVNTLSSSKGLVSFVPNSELDRIADEKATANRPVPQTLTRLAQFAWSTWEKNKRGKQMIEQKIMAGKRRIKGEYEPAKLTAIQQMKMPVFFMRLSMQKCRDLEGQLNALMQNMEHFCEVEPTPLPDIPPDVLDAIQQQVFEQEFNKLVEEISLTGVVPSEDQVSAVFQQNHDEMVERVTKAANDVVIERANNMQTKMEDQLEEGGFHDALRAVQKDIGEYPAVIVKGPIFRREKVLSYKSDPTTGTWTPQVENKVMFKFYRVNPMDWFPQADAKEFGKGNNIEIERFERDELADMLGMPGYKDEAIRKVLTDYPLGYAISQDIDQQRLILDNQTATVTPGEAQNYHCLNLWGMVPGDMLIEWGIDRKTIPDPIKSYGVNAKVIGHHVIKAVINPDPLNRQPYQGTAFRKSNDSTWGECVPDVMEDIEDGANAALRPLLKNMAMAATPITEVDVFRLDAASGENGDIWAGKVFRVFDKDGSGTPAVRVYEIPMYAESLMNIYEKFKREADDMVIPAFGHGNEQVGGAGNTASGLSMLRTDAARNVQLCFENIYNDIIIPITQKLFAYNMIYLDDPTIKGDAKIKVRSIQSIMAKEQLGIRRTQLLPITNNPVDNAIMGTAGRAYQLSEAFKAVEMDVDKAIPQMEEFEKQADMSQPQGPVGPQMMSPAQTGKPQLLDNAGNPVSGQGTAAFKETGV